MPRMCATGLTPSRTLTRAYVTDMNDPGGSGTRVTVCQVTDVKVWNSWWKLVVTPDSTYTNGALLQQSV